ncbi:MAG: hypothetical protein OEZ01_06435 [Candidatus Heimdallarchaeota archaeon]|nr:hypothetical protein [Candidatus Heimdallarchaeota archaeon]
MIYLQLNYYCRIPILFNINRLGSIEEEDYSSLNEEIKAEIQLFAQIYGFDEWKAKNEIICLLINAYFTLFVLNTKSNKRSSNLLDKKIICDILGIQFTDNIYIIMKEYAEFLYVKEKLTPDIELLHSLTQSWQFMYAYKEIYFLFKKICISYHPMVFKD